MRYFQLTGLGIVGDLLETQYEALHAAAGLSDHSMAHSVRAKRTHGSADDPDFGDRGVVEASLHGFPLSLDLDSP